MSQKWTSGPMEYVYCPHCEKEQPYKVDFEPASAKFQYDTQGIVCGECGLIAAYFTEGR